MNHIVDIVFKISATIAVPSVIALYISATIRNGKTAFGTLFEKITGVCTAIGIIGMALSAIGLMWLSI